MSGWHAGAGAGGELCSPRAWSFPSARRR